MRGTEPSLTIRDLDPPDRMTRSRPSRWLTLPLAALALCPPAATAHPVPSRAHLRTIDVRLRPAELCVQFTLEVDEWTVVYVDLPALLDAAELRSLTRPSQFYDAYLRRLGVLDDPTAEEIKNEALETMRQGIAEAEAEPEPDPELVFDNAYVLPPPNLREGWDA